MEDVSDYMFASPVADSLLCFLCHNIASEPTKVSCCDQLYCKRCLVQRSAKDTDGGICAKCREKWNRCSPDRQRAREIDNLMVRCYIASEKGGGCFWEGCLKELHAHKLECQWRKVRCKKCQLLLYFKDYEDHEKDACPNRPYGCPHCPYFGTYDEVTIIHYVSGQCPDQQTECPNGCLVSLKDLESHNLCCPNVPCRYADIGCSVTQTRAEILAHEKTSHELHLRLASDKIISLTKIVGKLKAEVRNMAQKPIAVFKMKKEDYELLKSSSHPWTSPSVYTHDRGYNICLKVFPCECNALSLSVHLLPGRYDDELPWPCQAQITVELLNQLQDDGHWQCTVDLETFEAKREFEPDQMGYGPKQFISYDELRYNSSTNTQYLKRDCLYFRVRMACDNLCQPWLSEFVWHRDKGTV